MNNLCITCKFWEIIDESPMSDNIKYVGSCSKHNITTDDDDSCKDWKDERSLSHSKSTEEVWHTKNLPNFPIEEGKWYNIPAKFIRMERRFDGGRGTEFYMFEMEGGGHLFIPDYHMCGIKKSSIN